MLLVIKKITRIFIWSLVTFLILLACLLYFFGDINRVKGAVEKNLKNQLTCTVKLGSLDWDWNGLKLGVTTSEISLYDKENNLVLQGGPTRFVWHIKNIITGTYSHFYSIETTDLYLNLIRDQKGIWNLISIFPAGPPPKVDNLILHNGIIYLIDKLFLTSKPILYKDFNLSWQKKVFKKLRRIDLTTRIGSLTSPSFLKVKGRYTESKKFDWKKNEINLSLVGKSLDLSGWHGYFAHFIKEPQIKKIDGEFSGVIRLNKEKGKKLITLRTKTVTKDFLLEFQGKEAAQLIKIPKTDFVFHALIDKDKINLKSFRSNIDELTYKLKGYIYNWSKNLPEVDLTLNTNKFNFKSVKPYLPLTLLPGNSREKIEPLNDEGFIELDLKLKGPIISPQYYGTVLLSDFNLTAESGFLNVIQGLGGKLILDGDIVKIDHLNIPIEGSPLVLKGEVDNKNLKTSFNLNGKSLSLDVLKNLLVQSGLPSTVLNEITAEGKLDLDLNVTAIEDQAPEIHGKINFHDTGFFIFKDDPLEVKNIFGELLLDGSKVFFNKLNGLINNEPFSINGNFSLKEDEALNLTLEAKHLKIMRFLLSLVSSKTPLKPVIETISGEASDLNLKVFGSLSKPLLDGMVLINNVSFSLPNLEDKISNITGSLRFEGTELIVEGLLGKIQNADFLIAGYIENLFTKPKPKLRIETGDIELTNFWNYIKHQLKTSSFASQADAIENLSGIAAVDIFLDPASILGNLYFKDVQLKYKTLPFSLNNLGGRLVIGEKNLSLFGLNGNINDSNHFQCDLTVFNYLDPSFYIQGTLNLNLDLPGVLKAINAPALNTTTVSGLIPTVANFEMFPPLASVSFHSTLDEMLQLDLLPYLKKPLDKAYTVTGAIDFDTKDMNLYLSQFNVMSNKLSLTTNGSIKNISSQNPELMLYFGTDEPAAIFMILEPVIPLMGYKVWGMIDLSGSVSGTPSMYAVSANAKVTDIRMPEFLGKKLTASDGNFNIYLDSDQGVLNSKLNNVKYVSFDARTVSLIANYKNPVIYLNELTLDGNPGSIFANGHYDPKTDSVSFNANGSNLELSSLGSFIFLDPEKISGMTDFSLMLEGSGKTKNDLIANSNGNLSFSVNDGKLGQVALLQKGLQFANLFGQGIFGFNLRNVFSLFFKYQDGSFNTLKGDLELNKGVVKAKEINYRAKDLFLNSYGFVDLVKSFVGLRFYGYLPQGERNGETAKRRTGEKEQEAKPIITSAISILPDAFGKKRFFIPFLSSTAPQHFKFEVKGDIKKPKKIISHTRRSFKWLRGKRLKKEYKFVPKEE